MIAEIPKLTIFVMAVTTGEAKTDLTVTHVTATTCPVTKLN